MEPQLEIPGGNGHPIAIAADVLPDKTEPVQASIPGLKPAFDVASALDLIEQAEQDASAAEAEHTRAVLLAKSKRQAADEANAHLRELIRDLNSRRHETRYESRSPDGDGQQGDQGRADAGSVSSEVDPTAQPEQGEAGSTPADSHSEGLTEPPPPSSPSRRRPRSRRRAQ